MIGRMLSYLFCLRKFKFTTFWGKKEFVKTCEQIYDILVSLSICLGNIWNMFPLSGEKYPASVGKVYYDRPFINHIRLKKDNILHKKRM